jgi:hypothetical protein
MDGEAAAVANTRKGNVSWLLAARIQARELHAKVLDACPLLTKSPQNFGAEILCAKPT